MVHHSMSRHTSVLIPLQRETLCSLQLDGKNQSQHRKSNDMIWQILAYEISEKIHYPIEKSMLFLVVITETHKTDHTMTSLGFMASEANRFY